ncbi:MAG: hypothetical protein A2Y17_08020 [Clostridiales bacterium GWF2_38_85]|nr:MAG: hypothetical protein A2Y17_08020 [Clostridiales bacterium GWF2_38_85]HBL83862.1 hypothetical protein [Clostridiales bacterium]
MHISDIDKNFKIESKIENDNLIWLDCHTQPFVLTGLAADVEGRFLRLPAELMERTRPDLAWLAKQTSGARLRFRTDSPFIALNATLPSVDLMCHMPLTGSSGFDVYSGKSMVMFMAPVTITTLQFEKLAWLSQPADDDGFRDITINFPLYNRVTSLAIGLSKDSAILPPKPTAYGKVVFYGSSITQGGVASRPGNNYANILAKNLDFELINLGFSGNAFGDSEIADYIASIPMAAFVMDYDFNSRSLDELRATHEPLYRKVRATQPNVPIIMITNPVPDIYCHIKDDENPRLDIIYATYQKALAEGDKNVRFINGLTLFGKTERDTCTVDNLHPNDLGFFRMAEAVYPVLREVLR